MKIGLDLDGVLADFLHEFAKVVSSFSDKKFDYSTWGLGLTESETDRAWEIVKHKHNFWLSIPAYRENIFAVATHRTMHPDDEIFYCTARVPSAGMPVMHQAQRWLTSNGIYGLGTSVIVKPSKIEKDDIYRAVGVTRAIDDYGPACVKMIDCLDRPWNRGETDAKRYKDLAVFLASCHE
jgi:hypothetical protein